jgi:hypothetical protein
MLTIKLMVSSKLVRILNFTRTKTIAGTGSGCEQPQGHQLLATPGPSAVSLHAHNLANG